MIAFVNLISIIAYVFVEYYRFNILSGSIYVFSFLLSLAVVPALVIVFLFDIYQRWEDFMITKLAFFMIIAPFVYDIATR